MIDILKALFHIKHIKTVPEEQYLSLLKKAEDILQERDEAREQLEKFARWRDNPMEVLEHYYPGLKFKETDLTKLTMEELMPYLAEIDFIAKSDAFACEMETLMKDLDDQLRAETENHVKSNMMRQMYIFITGMSSRFKQLSVQYQNMKHDEQLQDPNRII